MYQMNELNRYLNKIVRVGWLPDSMCYVYGHKLVKDDLVLLGYMLTPTSDENRKDYCRLFTCSPERCYVRETSEEQALVEQMKDFDPYKVPLRF